MPALPAACMHPLQAPKCELYSVRVHLPYNHITHALLAPSPIQPHQPSIHVPRGHNSQTKSRFVFPAFSFVRRRRWSIATFSSDTTDMSHYCIIILLLWCCCAIPLAGPKRRQRRPQEENRTTTSELFPSIPYRGSRQRRRSFPPSVSTTKLCTADKQHTPTDERVAAEGWRVDGWVSSVRSVVGRSVSQTEIRTVRAFLSTPPHEYELTIAVPLLGIARRETTTTDRQDANKGNATIMSSSSFTPQALRSSGRRGRPRQAIASQKNNAQTTFSCYAPQTVTCC